MYKHFAICSCLWPHFGTRGKVGDGGGIIAVSLESPYKLFLIAIFKSNFDVSVDFLTNSLNIAKRTIAISLGGVEQS